LLILLNIEKKYEIITYFKWENVLYLARICVTLKKLFFKGHTDNYTIRNESLLMTNDHPNVYIVLVQYDGTE